MRLSSTHVAVAHGFAPLLPGILVFLAADTPVAGAQQQREHGKGNHQGANARIADPQHRAEVAAKDIRPNNR